ncbi:MAG: hypothetical protein KKF85_08955 [Gammaproteobacteria bacterium]|nr:hypothetical protein [Rhodocyclaceae bacterium]MBU3910670.1 hypothetical protein [Gammaproteobacteria bacterium]MBU3989913.1 hypothetical protein [Gammaproteobacteria bacterium]MBU4005132.1 hypothetical protein [Gammaproteobacteria bacterium]MBU4021024.1 hypothetical protein [Gammaproteobacteria bacterium]
MTKETPNDPMDFLKNMWGNMGFSLPGMVTPTVDTDELGKRIADLKAVEGWLKSNLGLLQMTIQGLEMQRTTLLALQQMSQSAQDGEGKAAPNPFLNPASWPMPWNLTGGPGGTAPGDSAAPAAEEPAPQAPAKSADSAQKNKPKR